MRVFAHPIQAHVIRSSPPDDNEGQPFLLRMKGSTMDKRTFTVLVLLLALALLKTITTL